MQGAYFFRNSRDHFLFLTLSLILSIAASFLAVFGSIFVKIEYLSFLPVSFLLFLVCLMGLALFYQLKSGREEDSGALFSIEMASFASALVFAPISVLVVNMS